MINVGWLAFGLFGLEYISGKFCKNNDLALSGLLGMMLIGGLI